MSFSDLSAHLGALEVSKVDQVHGNIAALRSNNDLLKKLVARRGELSDSVAEETIRHIRDVRQQNHDLARASHSLIREAEEEASVVSHAGKGGRAARRKSAATKLKKVLDTKAKLNAVAEEFSQTLSLSIDQECRAAGLEPNTNTNISAQKEGAVLDLEAQDGQRWAPSETTALLHATKSNTEALLREEESNHQFLQERAEALEQVQSSVRDVNGIFKDLAMMIGDQGTQLNQIEVSVAVAKEQNQKAVREVNKTRRRTTSCRRAFYWLLSFAVAFISLYIIVLMA